MKSAIQLVLSLLLIMGFTIASAQETDDLIGTRWQLVSYGDVNSPSPVIAGSAVTLTFGDNTQAYGSGGCNGYGSTYVVNGDTIRFEEIISTLMACLEDGILEQEMAYLMALQSATHYAIINDQLIITYEGGQLVFEALVLANTQWQLVGYGQLYNPIAPLINTIVTLNFDDAQGISGSTGCNSFGGHYSATLDTIRFDDVYQTEMFCILLMEQEAAYLEALANASTYIITIGSLRIRYGDSDELVFEQVYPLVNTAWQLVSLDDDTPIAENSTVTLIFESTTRMSGTGGCNTYGGSYTAAGKTIHFSQIFSTRMFCDPLIEQESNFFSALETATSYTIVNKQLVISYRDGKTLVFDPMTVPSE